MKIAFIGKAFSGKSTAAQIIQKIALEDRCYLKNLALAYAVKKIAKECFGWDGKKDDRGRRLLQLIGTEVGREYDPDIWVRNWLVRLRVWTEEPYSAGAKETLILNGDFGDYAKKYYQEHHKGRDDIRFGATVDDIRFVNEAEAAKSKGFYIVRIETPDNIRNERAGDDSAGIEGHASEIGIGTRWQDEVIENTGNLVELESNLRRVWERVHPIP